MIDGLNARDPLDELGVVAVDVLDQFGLGVCRTGYQYCAGGTDCTDHVLKEGVILRDVPATDRVRFVMNVSSGMLRMHDDLVNIRCVEMKHPRFMVIDPDGSVIVIRQDILRNGNFQGNELKLQRPRVRTQYALRTPYIGRIPPFFWIEERYAPVYGATPDSGVFTKSLLVRLRRMSRQDVIWRGQHMSAQPCANHGVDRNDTVRHRARHQAAFASGTPTP